MSKAKCQRTGKEIELKDGFFASSGSSGNWEFVAVDAPEQNDYSIPVDGLSKNPEAMVDWLAHMSQKSWFKPDEFFDFINKFRNENGIYG